MTDRDAIIRELVQRVEKAQDSVKRTNERIEWCKLEQHGRGASDYRVGLYYEESALEGLMQDLGDELWDEAKAMDLRVAA